MEKREIKSVAELVNALEKGVEVEIEEWSGTWLVITEIKEAVWKYLSCNFRYSEPVEVVELWGYKNHYVDVKDKRDTHKQTQIIINGDIIWTETI